MLSVAGLAQESGVLAAPKGLFSGTTGDILLVALVPCWAAKLDILNYPVTGSMAYFHDK